MLSNLRNSKPISTTRRQFLNNNVMNDYQLTKWKKILKNPPSSLNPKFHKERQKPDQHLKSGYSFKEAADNWKKTFQLTSAQKESAADLKEAAISAIELSNKPRKKFDPPSAIFHHLQSLETFYKFAHTSLEILADGRWPSRVKHNLGHAQTDFTLRCYLLIFVCLYPSFYFRPAPSLFFLYGSSSSRSIAIDRNVHPPESFRYDALLEHLLNSTDEKFANNI